MTQKREQRTIVIAMCVNDRWGMPSGRVDAIKVMRSGQDWEPMLELSTVNTAGVKCEIQKTPLCPGKHWPGRIATHGRVFDYLDMREHVGNIHWTEFRFTEKEAFRLLAAVRTREHFSLDQGDTDAWELWKKERPNHAWDLPAWRKLIFGVE